MLLSKKLYRHYVDTACNSKHPVCTGTNRSCTILSGCALEQYLNTPFSRMFNSGESIWSYPGGSKFTCIIQTQDNLDIMFTGCQGQRTDCSAIITNLTRNAHKPPTSFLTPKDKEICPETIWIICFKIKFLKETKGAMWSVFLTQYCAGDKIEKNEMGWACSAYGWGEGGV